MVILPVALATRKAMAMSSQLRWASTYFRTAGGIASVYVDSQSRCRKAPCSGIVRGLLPKRSTVVNCSMNYIKKCVQQNHLWR